MRRTARTLAAVSASLCSLTVLGGASAEPAAAPDMRWSLDDKMVLGTTGPTSGAKMEEFRLIRLPGADEPYGGDWRSAFRGIQIGEASDRPCSVRFMTEALAKGENALSPFGRGCDKGNVGDWKSASLAEGAFLKSIAVCTNADNTRVKGVKIGGTKLDAAGKPFNVESASFERPNCKNWHPAVSCASGEIATAIRAYFKDDSLTAFGLECRPVYTPETNPRDFTIRVEPEGGLEPYGSEMHTQKVRVKIKNDYKKTLKFNGISVGIDRAQVPEYAYCQRSLDKKFEIEPGKTYEATLDVWCRWTPLLASLKGCAPGAECEVPVYGSLDFVQEARRQWYQVGGVGVSVKVKRPLATAKAPASPVAPKK